jgi:hypothetical protein
MYKNNGSYNQKTINILQNCYHKEIKEKLNEINNYRSFFAEEPCNIPLQN